ncbi:MAG TPA: hypothetical protein DCL60_00470 [Armatimonadetes bacterium]|jgi:hypothetical protein|nr:hypothetical protein [Armatimonadota bacterium]
MEKLIQKEKGASLRSMLSQMPEVEPPAFLLERIEAATIAKRVPAYTRRKDKYSMGMAVA